MREPRQLLSVALLIIIKRSLFLSHLSYIQSIPSYHCGLVLSCLHVPESDAVVPRGRTDLLFRKPQCRGYPFVVPRQCHRGYLVKKNILFNYTYTILKHFS